MEKKYELTGNEKSDKTTFFAFFQYIYHCPDYCRNLCHFLMRTETG